MYKNDLLQLLRTFSRAELRLLRKFLNSEYFGKKPKPAELLELLVKYHPMYTHVHLERKIVFKNLYPGKAYNDSTLRNLFCDLHESALHFMTIKNFESSEENRHNFLFNELIQKGLQGEFAKVIDKIEARGEEQVDWMYFLNMHFRETSKFNFSHYSLKMKKQKNLGSEISSLNSSVNNLVYYFITELVSLYLNYVFYKDSFDTKLYSQDIGSALSLIDFAKLKDMLKNDANVFVIELYRLLLNAFSKPDDITVYHEYKKQLNAHFNRLSRDEKCFHYYKLITYCVIGGQNKFTDFDYDSELLALYSEMLDKKYYLDRNTAHLPHELYRNMLFYSIRIRNYEWTEEFVRKYSFMVFPQDRENIYYYGNAYLSFNKGDYSKALEYINNIDLDFFIYKVDVKNLTLMIYFELGYTEGIMDIICSYREFIRKNKLLNPERKKRYISFSKFIEKMTLYRAGTLKQDIGYISHRLKLAGSTAFKPWLIEKLSMLEANIKQAG